MASLRSAAPKMSDTVVTLANHVNGRATAPLMGSYVDDVDPATNTIVARVPRSGPQDVEGAVAAARAAQPAWARRTLEERCDILAAIAKGIEREARHLAQLETQDTGKPITTSSTLDIPRAVRNFRFFAEFAKSWPPEAHAMEGGRNSTQRMPVGVVGLIAPWNLPLYLLTWKAAPALAMGNAVIAKPSELTPQTASALGAIAADAGLPSGLLNVVHGLGPEAGQAIVEHPAVGALSFTGGTATGRHVARSAAPLLKKLSLELGGKNPSIVLDDVDLEAAVAGVVRAGYTNAGQVCLCGSRVLVQAGLYDAFVVALREAVARLAPGDPMDAATRMGPLVTHAHRAKVEGYLAIARSERATVVGGGRPEMPGPLANGAFLEPAIVTNVRQASACVQEEIFGPVVSVQAFADVDEAVRLANDVPYGLSATVWSGDAQRARAVAQALDVGMVWINDWLVRDLRVPFGGVKQSGVGREGGHHSLEFFSEAKNIYEPA